MVRQQLIRPKLEMSQVLNVMQDRRSFPRTPVSARMRVSHTRIGTFDGFSVNVSDTGLMLHLRDLPKLPRGAHIALQMLDSVNPGIIFNTRVIHCQGEGLGLVIVDYELNGMRFTLDELRRQWHITRSDLDTPQRAPGRPSA